MAALRTLLAAAATVMGARAARISADFDETALRTDSMVSGGSSSNTSWEMKAMSGMFTASKYEFDPLTRYADGGSFKDGQRLVAWLQKAAELNPDELALRVPIQDEDGNVLKKTGFKKFHVGAHTHQYKKYTWKQYYDLVIDAAAAFSKMGLMPMDAVNIRGVNSPEWLITFLGCIAAGGLPVGLYPTDSPDVVKFKAQDSGATFIALGKAKDLDIYSQFLGEDNFSSVKAVVYWDANPAHPEDISARKAHLEELGRPVVTWDAFLAKGSQSPETRRAVQVAVKGGLKRPGEAMTVVYTSGTTGNPKGVMLSHDAVTWTAERVCTEILDKPAKNGQTRSISYLPLNHIAGQMMDIVGPLYMTSRRKGEYWTVYFPAKCFLKKTCFKEQLKDASPTLFLGVPEVWDGLKLKIEQATASWLFGNIAAISPALVLKGVGLGSVQYAVSGAGPITKSTLSFFHDMGLDILNLFAQSESSGMGTAWRNEDFGKYPLDEKFGSIGRPLGNKLRIAEPDSEGKGEIQLWGRNVMMGYLNRPEKTREALTPDGWLKTGDMGRQDKDGFVFLTGRLKEIMKDKGGEMIAPVAVEEGIKKACNKPGKSILKQAIVVGDGKYYISALLTLVEVVQDGVPMGDLAGQAKALDPDSHTVKDAQRSDKWASELSSCIAEYNTVAAKSQERVFRYFILPKDITAEDSPDLMTPTFKIKRTGVNEKYAAEISSCGGDGKLPDHEVKACGADAPFFKTA